MSKVVGANGIVGWGIEHSLWAYTGDRTPADSMAFQQMSTLNHVTSAFPPTYISGGNDDPLTDAQSKPLAES